MADLRARIIITASDETRQGFNSVREGVDNIHRNLTQARNALLGFFGISFSASFVKQLIEVADEYKNLQSAIKLSTESQKEFDTANTQLFAIAQRTSTGLRENVDLYRRVAGAVHEMGGSQERALGITELVGKAMALSGTSSTAAANGIQQFNQGMASGVLRGEEFNSVMENTPRLARALADGLDTNVGALRAMAEQGKLTTQVVLAAIESQGAALDSEFKQLPPTVERAMVRVKNAFTVVIGQIDSGKGSTASLAQVLNKAADNMRALVEAALALAKVLVLVYAGKFISGIQNYVAVQYRAIVASREAAVAAELEAAAQLEALRVQEQLTAARYRASLAALEEMRLQRALAVSDTERASAQVRLNAALAQTRLLHGQAAAASIAYRNAVNAEVATVSLATRAMDALNKAFFAFLAWEIGKTIGKWLLQFDKVRFAGTYVAETFTLVVTGFQAMLDGLSLEQRFAQIQQVHADYAALRAGFTAGETQSADARAQAEEQAAERQKTAWKLVEENLKSLTGSVDDQFTLQNAVLQQRLDARIAAIDASNVGELQKDAERTQAQIQSASAELELARNTADAKLQLIFQSYGAQIEQIGKYNDTARQLDRESIEARKGVYSQLAEHYQTVVDRLTGEHQREVQAAANAGQQIRDLAIQHQFDLSDISRQGLNERDRIKSEEAEFDKLLFEAQQIRTGKAKGTQEDVNEKLARASELNGDISRSTINLAKTDAEKSTERSKNADRLNTLYKEQVKSLEANKKAHEDNAKDIAKAQADALGKLQDVNTKIGQITNILNKQYALQITADTSAIDAAIAKINSIPTEKTVTIRTVNVAGAEVAAQTGGLIPGFADGGYPRRQGQLPGYGGGDKIPALLESGEYIIRKEAVRKLGVSMMAAINRGMVPVRRAQGGPALPDWKKQLLVNMLDPKNLAIYGSIGTGGLGSPSDSFAAPSRAMNVININLRKHGLEQYGRQMEEVVKQFFIAPYDKYQRSLVSVKRIEDQAEKFKTLKEQFISSLNNNVSNVAGNIKQGMEFGGGALPLTIKAPKLNIPVPNMPINDLLPAAKKTTTRTQDNGGADKTVTVKFVSPSGSTTASGVFPGASSVDSLLTALKEAGARTAGGF